MFGSNGEIESGNQMIDNEIKVAEESLVDMILDIRLKKMKKLIKENSYNIDVSRYFNETKYVNYTREKIIEALKCVKNLIVEYSKENSGVFNVPVTTREYLDFLVYCKNWNNDPFEYNETNNPKTDKTKPLAIGEKSIYPFRCARDLNEEYAALDDLLIKSDNAKGKTINGVYYKGKILTSEDLEKYEFFDNGKRGGKRKRTNKRRKTNRKRTHRRRR